MSLENILKIHTKVGMYPINIKPDKDLGNAPDITINIKDKINNAQFMSFRVPYKRQSLMGFKKYILFIKFTE